MAVKKREVDPRQLGAVPVCPAPHGTAVHGSLVLVAQALARVDGLCIAGVPRDLAHVSRHYDGPDDMVSRHLNFVVGGELKEARPRVLKLERQLVTVAGCFAVPHSRQGVESAHNVVEGILDPAEHC